MTAAPAQPTSADDDLDLDLELDLDPELVPVLGVALEPFEDTRTLATVGGEEGRRGHAITDVAELCIVRFAALEADLSTPDLNGAGRSSTVRFPRLGGVLHRRLAPDSRGAVLLGVATQRTIRAGYQAALATRQVADVEPRVLDADELWAAFVPASYKISRDVATTVWDVCRFEEFWFSVLHELGMGGDANRLAKGHVSPLSRSIRGLSTVGVALAVAERGGRYDRLARRGRGAQGHRRVGNTLPAAPGEASNRLA